MYCFTSPSSLYSPTDEASPKKVKSEEIADQYAIAF